MPRDPWRRAPFDFTKSTLQFTQERCSHQYRTTWMPRKLSTLAAQAATQIQKNALINHILKANALSDIPRKLSDPVPPLGNSWRLKHKMLWRWSNGWCNWPYLSISITTSVAHPSGRPKNDCSHLLWQGPDYSFTHNMLYMVGDANIHMFIISIIIYQLLS